MEILFEGKEVLEEYARPLNPCLLKERHSFSSFFNSTEIQRLEAKHRRPADRPIGDAIIRRERTS